MEPEDPRTVVDLRKVKSKEKKTKYNVFWDEARKYINKETGVAVSDARHHCEVTHMAKAISVRDLREQVTSKCPPGDFLYNSILYVYHSCISVANCIPEGKYYEVNKE